MSKARNEIIKGDYVGGKLYITHLGLTWDWVYDKKFMNHVSVIDHSLVYHESSSDTSGYIGFFGGFSSTKENHIYTVKVTWHELMAQRQGWSIIEIDEKLYKYLMIELSEG